MIVMEHLWCLIWSLFFALPDITKLIILCAVALVAVLTWSATPWGKNLPWEHGPRV